MEKQHNLETRIFAFSAGVAIALGSLAASGETASAQEQIPGIAYIHQNNAVPQLAPDQQRRKLPFPGKHGNPPRSVKR